MKNKALWIAVVILAAFVIGKAQGNQPFWFSVGPALHTSCTIVPNVTSFCYADDGAYQSIHGAAWVPMGGGGVPGVTSFNGRTGAVVAANGDYTYAQLSAVPPMVMSFAGRTGTVIPSTNDYGYTMLSGIAPMKPSFSCSTFSFINSANPPLAAGGCQ